MSTQGKHSAKNLKTALFSLPKGMPVTTSQMDRWGISRQLAHRYVQSGWLEPLGYGYYLRPGDTITQTGAVAAFEAQGVAVHIGGKTALSLHGVVHFLIMGKEKLFLYGTARKNIPEWFTRQFLCEVRMGHLFDEDCRLENRIHVRRQDENDPCSPFFSEPERALLEMLDDVPQKQTLDETRKIIEPLYTLRHDVLQTLLEACTRIKVKRLFFSLAHDLNLPVLPQLDLNRMDFGANSVYVLTKKGNSLILKNPGMVKHG